ncbi:hypothetical protein TGMAS_221900B [Toxoplasma gondii MAS]|uniref:Uncharacterized protein n=1 Tax=Toxoplasma gondii MAS TaxID=943118 RepID=A0A086QPL0_TOXGO|nr:hypothetical protein TGMAS_221900B [Toxoplasma gondii MAS]
MESEPLGRKCNVCDIFVFCSGAFAAEVEEAYRLQLDLQNRLIAVYRERLSPFDRDEMQRILAVWMDRPCEWSVARGGRRQTILRELKKHLRLPI